MIAYQTDENGIYVGTVICEESPLEPGVFLIPRNAVKIAPPSTSDKEIAIWNGDSWNVRNVNLPVIIEPTSTFGWSDIRRQRDSFLDDSDWTRMDDAPLSVEQKDAWAVYRQALRDIPQTFDSPDEVVWPTAP